MPGWSEYVAQLQERSMFWKFSLERAGMTRRRSLYRTHIYMDLGWVYSYCQTQGPPEGGGGNWGNMSWDPQTSRGPQTINNNAPAPVKHGGALVKCSAETEYIYHEANKDLVYTFTNLQLCRRKEEVFGFLPAILGCHSRGYPNKASEARIGSLSRLFSPKDAAHNSRLTPW